MEAFKAPTLDDALSAESEKDEDTETYALNESAQATLRDIFRDIDRNHDGKLQIPEIKVSLTPIAESCVLCHPCAFAFCGREEQSSISILLTGFISSMQGALGSVGLPRSQEYLREILKQYDHDGDGSIDW